MHHSALQVSYAVPNYGYNLRVSDFDFVWAPNKKMNNAKVSDSSMRHCAERIPPEELFAGTDCEIIANITKIQGSLLFLAVVGCEWGCGLISGQIYTT